MQMDYLIVIANIYALYFMYQSYQGDSTSSWDYLLLHVITCSVS